MAAISTATAISVVTVRGKARSVASITVRASSTVTASVVTIIAIIVAVVETILAISAMASVPVSVVTIDVTETVKTSTVTATAVTSTATTIAGISIVTVNAAITVMASVVTSVVMAIVVTSTAKMPKGIEWRMLTTDDRERLRGLSKEHAENIGLHILAAYTLEESNPELALEHAKWVARQASRIDFARETLAFVAYRQGDYKLALREFRTAFRMNGFLDYLPFIADCERGVGEPKKAIEVAVSDDAKYLRGEAKAEMFLVYAGALGDLKMWDKAIEIVHTLGRSKGLAGEYRMRAVQAEQYFLEEAGRTDEAIALDRLLDKLELQYADVEDDETSDDLVVEYDMQELNDELMDVLGISEDDAQYAPEDPENEEDESEAIDENGETNDETQLEAEETEAGAESDDEPAEADDAAEDDADDDGEAEEAEESSDASSESSEDNK